MKRTRGRLTGKYPAASVSLTAADVKRLRPLAKKRRTTIGQLIRAAASEQFARDGVGALSPPRKPGRPFAPKPSCRWTREEGGDYYETACGNNFTFNSDGPSENLFTNCPYCGRALDAQ